MSFFQRHQPQTLSDWLEVSTRKLAEPAKERIRAEIEAHYAEAVAGYVTTGLSQSAVAAAALADLGDAKAAAKRFRKRHLTKWEEQIVKRFLNQRLSMWALVSSYTLFAMICYQLFLPRLRGPDPSRDALLGLVLFFLMFVGLPTVTFFAARCADAAKRGRRLLLMTAASIAVPPIFLIFCFVISPSADPLSPLWCYVLGMIIFVSYTGIYLHVWRKLARLVDVPSPGPQGAQ
jgi:hypothetical protein